MNCAYHPDVQAEAYCRTCGKALCAACKREVKGVIYCEDCIASRVQDTIPAAAGPVPTRVPGAPNPAIATLLGFIPGVGAMYNGQFAKAFVQILIFASLIWAVDHAGGAEPFFGLLIAFFYFYMVVDSYKTARAKETGQPLPDLLGFDNALATDNYSPAPAAGEVDAESARRYGHGPLGAILLIVLGMLFLLDNMNLIRFGFLGTLWPLVLIIVGGWLFLRRRPVCPCQRCRTAYLMGPAVLVTLGSLFLLDRLNGPGFNRTWSVLLVVIGVVKFLQVRASMEGHIGQAPSGQPPTTALTTTEPDNTEVSRG